MRALNAFHSIPFHLNIHLNSQLNIRRANKQNEWKKTITNKSDLIWAWEITNLHFFKALLNAYHALLLFLFHVVFFQTFLHACLSALVEVCSVHTIHSHCSKRDLFMLCRWCERRFHCPSLQWSLKRVID